MTWLYVHNFDENGNGYNMATTDLFTQRTIYLFDPKEVLRTDSTNLGPFTHTYTGEYILVSNLYLLQA